MDFKRIKCPHCGKELPVPQDSKSLMCIFCFNLIELSDDNVSGKLSEDEARKEEFAVGGAVTSASPSPTSPEKSEQTWKASDRLGEAVPPVALQKSSDFGAISPATKNRKLLYIVAGFVCVMLFLIMANVMNRHGNDSRNAASTAQSSFNLGVPQPQENSETGMPAPASQEQSPTKEKNSEETRESSVGSVPKPAAVRKTPIQVLQAFHQNITNKRYREAYNYLSADFQNYVSYEGWAPGFRTTVSSSVSNVKIASQSDSQVVLTYILKAVDNPGGTRYFRGTATIIKTEDGWKIDEIMNKAQ